MISIFVEDNDAIIGSLRLSNDLFPWAVTLAVATSVYISGEAPMLTHVTTMFLNFNSAGEEKATTFCRSEDFSTEAASWMIQTFLRHNHMCTGLIVVWFETQERAG